MVINITSLTQNGLRDWLVQRVSAYILGLYFIFLLAYIFFNPSIDYNQWHHLFASTWIRIFSFLALLSLVLHAWVGIWTVLTDYVKVHCIRMLLEILLIVSLIAGLAWGIEILWGS